MTEIRVIPLQNLKILHNFIFSKVNYPKYFREIFGTNFAISERNHKQFQEKLLKAQFSFQKKK